MGSFFSSRCRCHHWPCHPTPRSHLSRPHCSYRQRGGLYLPPPTPSRTIRGGLARLGSFSACAVATVGRAVPLPGAYPGGYCRHTRQRGESCHCPPPLTGNVGALVGWSRGSFATKRPSPHWRFYPTPRYHPELLLPSYPPKRENIAIAFIGHPKESPCRWGRSWRRLIRPDWRGRPGWSRATAATSQRASCTTGGLGVRGAWEGAAGRKQAGFGLNSASCDSILNKSPNDLARLNSEAERNAKGTCYA